jgi:hypothetical protein
MAALNRLFTLLSVLATLEVCGQLPQPAIAWDGSQANFFTDDDGPGTVGFQFRAEFDINVTALGAFDYLGDGLATSHLIGIWAVGGGPPMVIATIPSGTNTPSLGQFRYVTIPGLSLSAQSEYIIAASDFYGTANDIYASVVPVPAFSTASAVTFLGARLAAEGPGLVFPTVHFEPLSPATFGANFQFVPVPEPATWALFGCGLMVLGLHRKALRRQPDKLHGREDQKVERKW